MDIQGILSTEGNYIESGNTYVSGTLNVSGNCETAKKDLRTFMLTEGQVYVGKDVNNIVFSMESDKDYVSIVVAPISVLAVIYICNFINRKDSIVIGCIVVLSVVVQFDSLTMRRFICRKRINPVLTEENLSMYGCI